MDRGAWQATVHGVARVGHNLVTKPPPPPQEKKKLSWVVTYICRFKFHCFLYGIHYRMFLHICFGSCCTNNRFHNGRQSPLCAEKSMAVQLSRGIYVSVQYINSNHTRIHRVWVFLHCSCCNGFPWMAADTNQKSNL